MITHPNYVQKACAGKSLQSKSVCYVYPLPDGVHKAFGCSMGFDTEEGFTTFEFNFDFLPNEPTDADLALCLPRNCDTCLLKGFHDCTHACRNADHVCPEWMFYPVKNWSEVAYYAKLHRERYSELFGST